MRLGGHTAALGMLLGVLAFPSVCQAGGSLYSFEVNMDKAKLFDPDSGKRV